MMWVLVILAVVGVTMELLTHLGGALDDRSS